MTTAETGARCRWQYPPKSDHPDADIFIFESWCKSCGICYTFCPLGVISSDKSGRPVISHPEKCIACGVCELMCPDMAITIYKKRKGKS
jgi:2-oxoglutarate ferredoxin oxidoreductase subunit delta